MKPKLFVGSSVKGLPYARALQKNLQYEAMVRLWPQGIFRTGQYPLDALIDILDDSDFGAFIFQPEDLLIMRGEQELAVRDNVLFELGMFIGRLGRDRSFFIKPIDQDLHLPSDLAGVTPSEFDVSDPNKQAGIGAAATDIIDRMNEIGLRGGLPRTPEGALPGYDRGAALEAAIAACDPKPLVHGKKYTRNELINEAGDTWIVEQFEDVKGLSAEPVTEIPTSYKSVAGRINVSRCESLTANQDVSRVWLDPESAPTRHGLLRFTPPITKDRAVSFKTERNVLNAIAFTKDVRRDVTGGQEQEESISMTFGHRYDSFLLQVTFPERQFPQRLRVSALNPQGLRDDAESVFVETQLTTFRETRNLLLQVASPLPGFKYQISWELQDDASGSEFDPVQKGFVDEMTRRLSGLRLVDHLHAEGVRAALGSIRAKILEAVSAKGPCEAALYVYDRAKSALACVASLDAEEIEKSWANYSFKPGRGIAGFAFRERKAVLYRREDSEKLPQTDRYELALNEDPATRPSHVICVPVFYGGRRERCAGILSLASRQSPGQLAPASAGADLLDRLTALTENWYATELAEALGVVSTAKFWRTETTGNSASPPQAAC